MIGLAPPPLDDSISTWWDETIIVLLKEKRTKANSAIIYAMWGDWKEMNKRVFWNTALLPDMVAHLVREEIAKGPTPTPVILWRCIRCNLGL